jgi:hypothetical protein
MIISKKNTVSMIMAMISISRLVRSVSQSIVLQSFSASLLQPMS